MKVTPALKTVTEKVIESQPELKQQAPVTTQIEQRGPVQVVTMVYENKVTNEKQRVITEYNEETKKTVIKEQTILPKVIESVTFEKSKTPEGDVKVVSNKIEEIKKEDKHIIKVIDQVSEKVPLVKENPIRFEVVSNEISNVYQITAIEPTTKEVVTVSVNYNKETQKVTVNDIQEQPKPDTVVPQPVEKPVVILTPEQIKKPTPEVRNVVSLVEKTVEVKEVKEIK